MCWPFHTRKHHIFATSSLALLEVWVRVGFSVGVFWIMCSLFRFGFEYCGSGSYQVSSRGVPSPIASRDGNLLELEFGIAVETGT